MTCYHDNILYELTHGQNAHLQWLAAVELGLLKGRHPLLKDVDVTINPSKGLALLEGRASPKKGRAERLLNPTNGSATNPPPEMTKVNDTARRTQPASKIDVEELHVKIAHGENNVVKEADAVIDPTTEGTAVVQTAQVVLNMLDATVPETLSDEQKKKVMTCIIKLSQYSVVKYYCNWKCLKSWGLFGPSAGP